MIVNDVEYYMSGKTELQYLEEFITYFTGLDARITCNTTVSQQFADDSNTATFDFSIDGKYIIRMRRNAVNANDSGNYNTYIVVNGVEYHVSYMFVKHYSYAYDYVINPSRDEEITYRIKTVIGEKFIGIWFGTGWYGQAWASALLPTSSGFVFATDGTNYIMCGKEGPSMGSYVDNINLLDSQGYTPSGALISFAQNVMAFSSAAGSVQYTNHCIVISSSEMVFDVPDLVTCTTLTEGSTIALSNGKRYIAIGPHTLAPLPLG